MKKALKIGLILCATIWSALPILADGSSPKAKPKTTAESLYNEGTDLMLRGQYGPAAAKFQEALKLKEDFAEAHNNLGFSLRKQGAKNFEAALKHYGRALELNPKLAQAYHYRGVLHVLASDEAAAKADHAKLVALDQRLADELLKVIASKEEPEGYLGTSKTWP
jgi:tetratricopeptide (TPR) repeat protein